MKATMSSVVPHSMEYRTRTPRWFPDPRRRTSDRQPTPSGPTTWRYDGDRRRRRQMKTETDEDGDRRRQTHSGDERSGSSLTADDTPRVTKTELDTSPLMQPADSRAYEEYSSLCSPRSSRGTAPVLSILKLLSGKRMVTKR